MDGTQQLSNIIGNIYDAALDPTLWPSALEHTCAFVEGVAAGLVVQDPILNTGQFYFSWGLDPYYERLYLEKYIKINTSVNAILCQSQANDVVSTEMLMPYDEFLASRFHVEWAMPQGYCDFVGVILDKSATSVANLSVIRHARQGKADEGARFRMGLLAPHFCRAVQIGKVIDLHKIEAATLADTLDGLTAAIILVDANGRIVHANVSGQALLEKGAILQGTDGRLATTNSKVNQSLHDVFAAAGGGDLEMGVKGIAVSLSKHDGERWLAHILPLTSGARRKAGSEYSAAAAVFVRKAGLDLPHPLETITNIYRLTPAEMRVLMAIVQIGGVSEIAPVLGISEATVKTHLAHLFAKTDTSRQADLVKLVAGHMSPLGG